MTITPTCPLCPEPAEQRVDTKVGSTNITSCVCVAGHLFVVEWDD